MDLIGLNLINFGLDVFNIHVTFDESKLDKIISLLNELKKENKMTFDDLKLQVEASTTVEQSALVLLNQLHQMLLDAKTDPVALDAVITQLGASSQALAEAIKANTV